MKYYYPGSPEIAKASVVRLVAGQQLAGTDIDIRSLQVHSLQGVVQLPIDSHFGGSLHVELRSPAPTLAIEPTSSVVTSANKFVFNGVAEGEYRLSLLSVASGSSLPPMAGMPLHIKVLASQEVVVGTKDLNGVFLSALPSRLTGAISLSASEKHLMGQIVIELVPLDGRVPMVRLHPEENGRFECLCNPIDYLLHLTLPPRLFSTEVLLNNQVMTEERLDLAFTQTSAISINLNSGRAAVRGTVPQSNAIGSEAVVIAVSNDWHPEQPRAVHVRSNASQFVISNLVPGAYHIFAAAAFDSHLWNDLSFIKSVSSRAPEISLNTSEVKEIKPVILDTDLIDAVAANVGMAVDHFQ